METIGEKMAGTGGGEVDWGKNVDVSKLRDSAASASGVELTGLGLSKRLDVVSVTKTARKEARIPADMYVVNDTGLEGILMLQNNKGEVFEAMGGKTKKAFDSLESYLNASK